MESQKQDLQGWIVETLKASYASIDVGRVALLIQPLAYFFSE
jgi:hypothetical protein